MIIVSLSFLFVDLIVHCYKRIDTCAQAFVILEGVNHLYKHVNSEYIICFSNTNNKLQFWESCLLNCSVVSYGWCLFSTFILQPE